jgi:hypothetical protein
VNYTKTIVCLANSRRPPSGRCIAGKEKLKSGYGAWIRPVSDRPGQEVSLEERRYEDGQDPRVLDIIEVPMIGPAPTLHQTENHIIDADYYWVRKGDLPWEELESLLDKTGTLWPNGDSSYNGINDRLKQNIAATLTGSLFFIEPKALSIRVQMEGGLYAPSKRKVRAKFKYGGVEYLLTVTDPVAESFFLSKGEGDYPMGDTFLCVSLGGVYERDNCCYKLVAGLISKRPLRDKK